MSNLQPVATQHSAGILNQSQQVQIQNSSLNNVARDQTINNIYNSNAEAQEKLKLLEPVSHNLHYPPQCMEGTRKSILNNIYEWLNDFDSDTSNVMWITGMPGTGKSAIASTLIHKLSADQKLGGSHFFKRDDKTLGDPTVVWRTIAYDMASAYPCLKHQITAVLNNHFRLDNILWHFNQLIDIPLHRCMDELELSPPVFVIDALDECMPINNLHYFKDTMQKWLGLPKCYKLVLTGRPGSMGKDFPMKLLELQAGDATETETKQDIAQYIQASFNRNFHGIYNLKHEQIEIMTEKAAGLFIWASTSIMFLTMEQENDPGIKKKLDKILAGTSSKGIDDLYNQVLSASFGSWSPERRDIVIQILGTIFLIKAPLQKKDVLHFITGNYDPEDLDTEVSTILQYLQPVVSSENEIVIRHLSFKEYLTKTDIISEYKVDLQIHTKQIGTLVFKILNEELKFNICGIETSYKQNKNITNLDDLITHKIPNHLQYCCKYWYFHYEDEVDLLGVPSNNTKSAVGKFLLEKLLFWLEVMSALNEVSLAMTQLKSLNLKITRQRKIKDFLTDSVKFVSQFCVPIKESIPHIYISSLLFLPENSEFERFYLPFFGNIPFIVKGGDRNWTMEQYGIQFYNSIVYSVTFLNDDKHLGIELNNGIVLTSNVETGQIISGPFKIDDTNFWEFKFSDTGKIIVYFKYNSNVVKIHSLENGSVSDITCHEEITAIAISPNDKIIAFALKSGKISIWEANSEVETVDLFKDQNNSIQFLAFCHNEKTLVFASKRLFTIWNIETKETISYNVDVPLHDKSSLVSFSVEGKRVAIYDHESKNLTIWNVESNVVVVSFYVACGGFFTFEFSPDGQKIVCALSNHEITIHNSENGDQIAGPYQGHTEDITSLAFSADGNKLVSGSWDNTVRIWNTKTENTTESSVKDKPHLVGSVAFSHDGNTILSVLDNGTVRIWDIETGNAMLRPLICHNSSIVCCSFSSDVKMLAVGLKDGTILISDIQTGEKITDLTKGYTYSISSVLFSSDSLKVAFCFNYDKIGVWDIQTETSVVVPIEGTHIAWSCNNILSVANGNNIMFCNIDSDIMAGPFYAHTRGIDLMASSPNGKLVASISSHDAIKIWNVEMEEIDLEPIALETYFSVCVAFSPDGKMLVSGGSWHHEIIIWDIETGNTIAGPIECHTSVKSLVFSPDGKRFASTFGNETIRIWDLEIFLNENNTSSQSSYSSELQRHSDTFSSLNENYKHSAHSYKLKQLGGINTLHIDIFNSGWVKYKHDHWLFWVPHHLRERLCSYETIQILGGKMVKLNFSNFKHGTNWTECYTPLENPPAIPDDLWEVSENFEQQEENMNCTW